MHSGSPKNSTPPGLSRDANRAGSRPPQRQRGGFTLVELLVTIAIVVIVLGMATMTFRNLFNSNAVQTAVNTLTNAASIARTYAIENAVETLLVVNPHSGRLEIWHENPPAKGGAWDPMSRGTGAGNTGTDGFAYANVLDSSVTLPLDASRQPLVVVHPIDYRNPIDTSGSFMRPNAPTFPPGGPPTSQDNLNWVALCFDTQGRLVQRLRRFATRVEAVPNSYQDSRGALSNRRPAPPVDDASPDVSRLTSPNRNPNFDYAVDSRDSLIATCLGFVASDARAYREIQLKGAVGQGRAIDVWNWLDETQPGRKYQQYSKWVMLSAGTARPVASVE